MGVGGVRQTGWGVRRGAGRPRLWTLPSDDGCCLADVGFANRRSDFLDNGFVFENMEGQVCVPAGA